MPADITPSVVPRYTPIQTRILTMLSSGKPVDRRELVKAIGPGAKFTTLHVHMAGIRSKLLMIGQDVVCRVSRGAYFYQHVILLKPNSAEDETIS